jgi:hypothetical protein
MLGVTIETLAALRRRGEGPPYSELNCRTVRYAISDLQAWVSARRVVPQGAPTAARGSE